jgi:four helix bundle protein
MNTARTEAREASYWLRLSAADGLLPQERLTELVDEADEICRILAAIVRNARQNEKC